MLLAGWQLGSVPPGTDVAASSGDATAPQPSGGDSATNSPPSSSSTTGSASGGSTSGATSETSTAPVAPDAASGAADGTYTGSSVSTRFGDVQVQVTISGGAISEVTPLHLTDAESRSIAISNAAAPRLRSEVLQAQSADVSMIGGATYTSEGYLTSLQSALDEAGF